MLLGMIERGERVHSAVFFDTGWEFPQMHEHIEHLRAAISPVPIVTLRPKVPFLRCMMDRPVVPRGSKTGARPRFLGWGWPSPLRRWCTREKTEAISSYVRTVPEAVQCIGFADDEAHRVDTANMRAKKGRVRFPLIEWGMCEAEALTYCRKLGFTWSGLYDHFRRVSCFCCPLQSLADLRLLRRHYSELWTLMLQWDRQMPDNRGFRDYATVNDLEARFAEEGRHMRLPGMEICA